LTIGLLVLVTGGVIASIKYNQRGIVDVQTGRVVRQDLVATVTASGEIKPKNYINLGANTLGPAPITEIMVKEGDRVRKGQVVAKMQSVQANADVVAQNASIATSLADSAASEAGLKSQEDGVTTSLATLEKNRAELDRTKANYDRSAELYKEKLLAKQDFDQKKAEYDTAVAAMGEAEARLNQARAQEAQARQQLTSAQKRILQLQANLDRYKDILSQYYVTSPIDGIVTNLPVRAGETVVPGVQNSAASTIMTIADMSVITAEVKVDETDIVNVSLNQRAEVTIDAMPNRTFHGHVTEIGDTAILRSSGVAASQSNTSDQEAKDFKVVVAPGADRAQARRSGPGEKEWRRGSRERSSDGEGQEGRTAGSIRGEKRQGAIPAGDHRDHGCDGHRSSGRLAGKRPDYHGHLQDHPHPAQSG
jgi:HlyD family secretion protein